MTDVKTKSRKKPADRLKKRKKPEITLRICLDDDLVQEVEDLEAELELAKFNKADTAEIESRLEDATARRDAETEVLTLRSIGRIAFRDLKREHPPTDEQVAEWQKAHATPDPTDPKVMIPATSVPEFDTDTFPPALIAACLVPPWTPEEVEDLTEDWNDSEFMQLWASAMAVCNVSRIGGWGKA